MAEHPAGITNIGENNRVKTADSSIQRSFQNGPTTHANSSGVSTDLFNINGSASVNVNMTSGSPNAFEIEEQKSNSQLNLSNPFSHPSLHLSRKETTDI
jgi:hypothetical protein